MENAEEIVVAGGSAGGIAAMLWTEEIKSEFKMTKNVKSLIDSGLIFDILNEETKTYRLR